MSESKLQAKILNYLKEMGYWTIKVTVANKKGIMDIIACEPVTGLFIGIEVKWGTNKPSELQSYNIREIKKRGGKAFVAWSLEDVKEGLLNGYRQDGTEEQAEQKPRL